MRFLCVCHRGNSRSVALAWILKDILHHEAIAIGIEASSLETREMLGAWADTIICVDQSCLAGIPLAYLSKTRLWHVGGDRFFRGFHPELLNLYAEFLARDAGIPKLIFEEPEPFLITIRTETPDPKADPS